MLAGVLTEIMSIIVAVLILVVSVAISNQIGSKKTQDQKEILSVSATPSHSSNNSQVTIKKEVKDNSSTPQTFNLSDFKYPNSNQSSGSGNNIILESNDNPDLITDWYKEKIRSLGFKSKSFVQTKTNGNILNKLVAASGNREIRVEIEKSANSPKVSINLSI